MMKLKLMMAWLVAGLFFQAGYAQLDSNFAYCNLFYLTSDHPEILPFDNLCFLNDNYDILNYHRMRVVGPIRDMDDIFREYDYSLTFYFPEVTADARLVVEKPADLLNPEKTAAPGKCFFVVSDNRSRRQYGPGSDQVDYVTVSGKARITEFFPLAGGNGHPEFNCQLDVYLQAVDRSGPVPVLTGPLIRIKAVLAVKKIEPIDSGKE